MADSTGAYSCFLRALGLTFCSESFSTIVGSADTFNKITWVHPSSTKVFSLGLLEEAPEIPEYRTLSSSSQRNSLLSNKCRTCRKCPRITLVRLLQLTKVIIMPNMSGEGFNRSIFSQGHNHIQANGRA